MQLGRGSRAGQDVRGGRPEFRQPGLQALWPGFSEEHSMVLLEASHARLLLTCRHLGALEVGGAQSAHRLALLGRQKAVHQQQHGVLADLQGSSEAKECVDQAA